MNRIPDKTFSKSTITFLIVVVGILVAGVLSTILVGRWAEGRERADLLSHAQLVAHSIGAEDINALTGTPTDLENPKYQNLKKVMADLKSSQEDAHFVYLMGYRGDAVGITAGDKLFFYIDSENQDSEGYSAPGDVYEDTDDVQRDAYKNAKSITEGPYKDSFGEWVSGFAPIIDLATGKTVALVGIDIGTKIWREHIFEMQLIPILATVALLSLLIAYAIFRKKTDRFIKRIEIGELEAEEQRNRLRTLYEITTHGGAHMDEQIREALKVGNGTLFTKMAMLNRIEGDKFTVLYCVVPPNTLKEGDSFKLQETYCDITVHADDVVAISAMGISQYNAHVCYDKFHLESYIGVPVKVHGVLFGTLTFLAPDPHKPEFSESDKDFVRLMGAWISATLERQEVDKMKSEFVSVASHQLRTPLTGIKWFAELMLRGKAGEVSADQKDFLTQIHDSNERMIKLVEDLLNVSRIETGTKFEIKKAPTDIMPILDSLATDLIGLAEKHKVKIIRDTNFPQTLMLNVDRDKIRQVFGNLLSNAVKYSHEGGEVKIGVDMSDAKSVTFSIADTGLGIPQNAKGRMFEKFFRAENVQTQETDGTGLGLYIVKAITIAHGGMLDFTSEENKGTTFYLRLLK